MIVSMSSESKPATQQSMNTHKATIRQAWPYQQSVMDLPVNDLDAALPFYIETMGFRLMSQTETPHKSACLVRDAVQIGLSENGGDPAQDGCVFEVDNIANALAELIANGWSERPEFQRQQHGTTNWNVFFVVAPDGLCYCYGERQGE